MEKITSITYIILGFSVSLISILMNIRRGVLSFTFFAIIGFFILLYGLFHYFKRKKKSKKNLSKNQQINNQHSNHNKMHVQHIKNSPLPNIYCPKCGNSMKSYDNYCSNCGFRVR
ncbi:MAG: zinc ribbon domain-containing protein [Candidatus Woesearchaeota archaeon]